MNGQWAPDPHQRAELRYWDGSRWTEHISNGGVVGNEAAKPAPRPNRDVVATGQTPGRLVAAGVMTIIEASLMLILGLWMFSLSNSTVGGIADDLTGGALTFITLLITGIGVTLLAAGVGSCRGRHWARITVVVLHGIGAAFFLIAAVSGGTSDPSPSYNGTAESSPVGGFVVALLWFGTIILLAATARPDRTASSSPSEIPTAAADIAYPTGNEQR